MQNADITTLGFIIVALFGATWVIAVTIWRFAQGSRRNGPPASAALDDMPVAH